MAATVPQEMGQYRYRIPIVQSNRRVNVTQCCLGLLQCNYDTISKKVNTKS